MQAERQAPQPLLVFLGREGAVGVEDGDGVFRGLGDEVRGMLPRLVDQEPFQRGTACSACTADGSLAMTSVIARACAGDNSPAAWAAATSGYSGSIGAPVKSTRGPSSLAAFTRAPASVGDSRNASTSSRAVLGAARSRCTAEPITAAISD